MNVLFFITLLFSFSLLACVDNPIDSLESLKIKESYSFKLSDSSNKYTMSPFNFFGIHNHFQGVIKDGDRFYVTGGNKSDKSADLFSFSDKKSVSVYQLNKTPKHWHAGSLQKLNDKLIIPIERLEEPLTSEIIEYDLITKDHKSIFQKKSNKTGAIDFLSIQNKSYIFLFDPKEISIYEYPSFAKIKSLYIPFFTDSSAKVIKSCSNEIYLINITNDGLLPPLVNGKNVLNIYKFNLENFNLKKLKDIYFESGNGNFRGAVNIQNINDKLFIITSSMYLDLFDKKLYIDIYK